MKALNILILILFFSSCRFVHDIDSYQPLDKINYDNIFHGDKNEFRTLFSTTNHRCNVEYFSDSLIFKTGIDSALWNRLELFCDTFGGHGFGPNCWHMNNCYNVVAVGKKNSSNYWIKDSLKFYTNADSLINFLGQVNNFDKVIFYLGAHQYFFDGLHKDLKVIKEKDNGYYCIVHKTISDCPMIRREILLFVSYKGEIIEIKKGRKHKSKICV